MLLKSSNYFHYCFSKKILQKRNLNGGSKLQVRIQKKLFPKAVDSIKFLMVYSRPLFPFILVFSNINKIVIINNYLSIMRDSNS